MTTYQHLNVYMNIVWNRIYNAIYNGRFFLFPALREEREGVGCIVIIAVPPPQRVIICAHADLFCYYYIACSPQRSGLVPSDRPPPDLQEM